MMARADKKSDNHSPECDPNNEPPGLGDIMASEFIKQCAAEWAAYWNYNYRSFGGTDPKMFFRHEHCLYTAPDGSVTNYEDIVKEKFGAPKKAGFGPSPDSY